MIEKKATLTSVHLSRPEPEGALVSVQKCPTYETELLRTQVIQLLQPLGGLAHLVKYGDVVLLKPNMLSAKAPEQAVTTHPMLLSVVLELLLDLGARPEIGDSPSNGTSDQIKRHWHKTGFLQAAAHYNVKLRNFETEGSYVQHLNGRTYPIAKSVLDADVVINLPKMKTHGLVLLTGAIKNCFGCIPGLQKAEFHKLAPHPDDFSQILVDIFSLVKPDLNIMDGIWSMAGNGPSSGERRDTGLLLASTDGVALDSVVAQLLGFQPEEITTSRVAAQRGLGIGKLADIKIAGMVPDAVAPGDFPLPSNRYLKMIPDWLVQTVGKFIWVRPQPDEKTCRRCGICSHNCPVQAIKPKADGFPVIDHQVCIKCMCCDESCPHNAIHQQLSWLAQKLS